VHIRTFDDIHHFNIIRGNGETDKAFSMGLERSNRDPERFNKKFNNHQKTGHKKFEGDVDALEGRI